VPVLKVRAVLQHRCGFIPQPGNIWVFVAINPITGKWKRPGRLYRLARLAGLQRIIPKRRFKLKVLAVKLVRLPNWGTFAACHTPDFTVYCPFPACRA